MISRIRSLLWNQRKEIGKWVIVCGLVAVVYISYLFVVGIPRTQARNFYNSATLLLADGEIDQAKQELERAYAAWPEDYVASLRSALAIIQE